MNDTTTLWNMLEKGKITVPQIQRDYAQGRKGKEYIRRTFLHEIKKCLENDKNDVNLTLDFVYGNTEDGAFCPLDGQQRLTTLWLLHWYFSFKSGSLDSEKETLKNFSYQTRISSREFCEALCDKMNLGDYKKCQMSVAEYIKSQTWFYSSWLQDPTISSMLRIISGDGKNTDDNIEDVFDKLDFETYRERVHTCVRFFRLNIGTEKLPISDDLYIKMNARGKGLTNFENFKADLLAWFRSDENPEKNEDLALHFAKLIDTTWTDVFWNSAKADLGEKDFKGQIDEIFFSFFNRFVVNMICLEDGISVNEFAPEDAEDENKTPREEVSYFNKLYGTGLGGKRGADDGKVSYEGFEPYKKYLTFENIEKIDAVLKKISDDKIRTAVTSALSGIRDDEDEDKTQKCFIPQYNKEDQMLNKTKQKERIYFHAVFMFLVTSQNFGEPFDRWMRVVKNITENAAVDSVRNMISCLRKIDDIAAKASSPDYAWNVYKCLSEYTVGNLTSQLDQQLKEEQEKAEKLCEAPKLERDIKEAEECAFFNGTIRFLYRDENGEPDWENFKHKFENAKNFFEGNDVRPRTVRTFLSLFNDFSEIKDRHLFTTIGYHPRNNCWKKGILCSSDEVIKSKVHDFLMGKAGDLFDMTSDYRKFLQSEVIETIINKGEDFKYRCREWNNGFAIHKMYSQSEGVYVNSSLFESLKKCDAEGDITIKNEPINNNYYWGIRIEFKWQNESYCWYGGNKIYRIEGEKEELFSDAWENHEDLLEILKNKGDSKNG